MSSNRAAQIAWMLGWIRDRYAKRPADHEVTEPATVPRFIPPEPPIPTRFTR